MTGFKAGHNLNLSKILGRLKIKTVLFQLEEPDIGRNSIVENHTKKYFKMLIKL